MGFFQGIIFLINAMWVNIHKKQNRHSLGLFDLNSRYVPLSLEPDTKYILRLYGDPHKPLFLDTPLKPVSRSDIFVIKKEIALDSDDPAPSKEVGDLLLRIEFTLDNDLPISKKIRWVFAQEKGEEYHTYRIAFLVSPRRKSSMITVFSLVGVIWLSGFFEFYVTWLATGESWANLVQWTCTSLVASFILFVLLCLLLPLGGFLYSSKDE